MEEERNWCVYQHICPNGKTYVGITSQKPETRWAGGFGYRINYEFFSMIVKYGWDNIIHQVVHAELTEEEARELEKSMIKSLGIMSCNIVHKIKDDRNGFTYDPIFDKTQFAVDELTAIRMWSVALYGDVEEEHLKEIASTHIGWTRTVDEFASGDKRRIAKELAYIDGYRVKRLGEKQRKYTDEEIGAIAEKLSGPLFDRYCAV